jgi:hypothetical protein
MTSHLNKLGYRDTHAEGDAGAPVLQNELDAFKEKINKGYSYSRFADREFFSCITPYGKEQIKDAFYTRIFEDDRHMTLLWFHPNEYNAENYRCRDNTPPPKFQMDGISPPVQGQRGGWYECPETNELKKIPDIYKWNFWGGHREDDGKFIHIKKGELCSLDLDNGRDRQDKKLLNGTYVIPPHYEPHTDEKNAFQGDVKSAILSSCLDDKDKQELLDAIYTKADPIRDLDGYFCKKVKAFLYDKIGNKDHIESEIRLHKDLPQAIHDNLLVNLGVMKDEDACYSQEGFYDN